jgi:histidyl-tRNA synthetase
MSKKQLLLQAPKGMHDVLPGDAVVWDKVRAAVRHIADTYGFSRIETPTLEAAELYERGTGVDTDVVTKEMYTLKTKGGDMLALRPEATPGIMRAYFEHHLGRAAQPQKLWWEGSLFRHENTQAGRYRQFTQADIEVIGGENDPIYDAEVIIMFQRLLEEVKLKGIMLSINSVGCRVCRPGYRRALQSYYKRFEKKLCADCTRRLKTNPLRLLDCKKEQCAPFKADAPNILDKLCHACSTHMKSVLEYLDEVGILYTLDNRLVRGLDYYSRTVFEFTLEPNPELGAVAGGGRYDYLGELIGARTIPAVGGAAGLERIIAALRAQKIVFADKPRKKVFLVHVGDLAKRKSLAIIESLRKAGVGVGESLGKDSLRAQLKTANKEGIHLALIFGQREIFEERIIIRDLDSSLQETIPLASIVEEVKKRLKTKD